jgi:hypothetical protein
MQNWFLLKGTEPDSSVQTKNLEIWKKGSKPHNKFRPIKLLIDPKETTFSSKPRGWNQTTLGFTLKRRFFI